MLRIAIFHRHGGDYNLYIDADGDNETNVKFWKNIYMSSFYKKNAPSN